METFSQSICNGEYHDLPTYHCHGLFAGLHALQRSKGSKTLIPQVEQWSLVEVSLYSEAAECVEIAWYAVCVCPDH